MEMMIQQLINGLFLGSIYALLALGYTMVYGIIKLINFAHGEVYMIGSFIGYFLINQWQLGFFPALFISMIASAALGVTIEFLAYRPLRNSTRISALITAIGVSYFLQNVMIFFFSANVRPFPQAIERQTYSIGFVQVSNVQLLILAVSVTLMILALGSALAAAGGMLIGLYYNSIDPSMGVVPGLKSFVAAVLGGIGIIPGAALGGFVIGLVETAATALGFSDYKDALVYVILIIILLVRPAGILGKNIKEKV